MEWSPTKPPSGGASGYETRLIMRSTDGYTHWSDSKYYNISPIHTIINADIYRYDDGVNTNKIEFFNDAYTVTFLETLVRTNKNFGIFYEQEPQLFGTGDKEYFNNEHCYGRMVSSN